MIMIIISSSSILYMYYNPLSCPLETENPILSVQRWSVNTVSISSTESLRKYMSKIPKYQFQNQF